MSCFTRAEPPMWNPQGGFALVYVCRKPSSCCTQGEGEYNDKYIEGAKKVLPRGIVFATLCCLQMAKIYIRKSKANSE